MTTFDEQGLAHCLSLLRRTSVVGANGGPHFSVCLQARYHTPVRDAARSFGMDEFDIDSVGKNRSFIEEPVVRGLVTLLP